jgi:hypothetical protein
MSTNDFKNTSSESYLSFAKSPYSSLKVASYFSVYDELFSKYIGKNITFIEVGVLGGGSLFMWRDYFGPNAKIIGIDFNPGAKRWEKDGFKIYVGNQADPKFWQNIFSELGNIDVILDDGGHTYEQQIVTVESCKNYVNDGGMIVVEDTHTSYMRKFGPKKYSFAKYAHNITNRINDRFHLLSRYNVREDIFSSVRFFQSIVAFEVDRNLATQCDKVLENNKNNTNQMDYRFHDHTLAFYLEKLINEKGIIQKLLIVKPLLKLVRYIILGYISFMTIFKIKKYFKN